MLFPANSQGTAAYPFPVHIDRAGEVAAVRQGHAQRGDGIHYDVAIKGLRIGGDPDLHAIGSCRVPTVAGGVADYA